ncbi:MAG TPA: type II secretion system F family protein [archaeon]|jgi:archaellum biogenesis protein FlaJ (TadC family)|nr:type II secretion system F family protein [archaeon]HPV66124.1 type II secretion system F family protein [archaeon]
MSTKKDKVVKSKKKLKSLYRLFIPIAHLLRSKEFDEKLMQADILEEPEVYLSRYFFYAIFIPLILVILFSALLIAFHYTEYLKVLFIVGFSSVFIILIYALVNPYIKIGTKVGEIKNNLPLAILSMSSVAESGAPPEAMFHTSTMKSETPNISREFEKINKYLSLGLSLPQAMEHVCDKTPSPELKKFLMELKSNIEAGGSLPEFMKKKAQHAQFTYKLMLDNQNKKAETFGDIYSAIVIAGPLFLFSAIMLLGMIGGGGLGGLSVEALLVIGVFGLVPLVNILFIIILQFIS